MQRQNLHKKKNRHKSHFLLSYLSLSDATGLRDEMAPRLLTTAQSLPIPSKGKTRLEGVEIRPADWTKDAYVHFFPTVLDLIVPGFSRYYQKSIHFNLVSMWIKAEESIHKENWHKKYFMVY